MKPFEVGEKVKARDSKLPEFIHEIFSKLDVSFSQAGNELSLKQKEKSAERVNKSASLYRTKKSNGITF